MDFIIVGGGIYGSGVAWELARRGAEVLLLEANTVAGGASGGLGKRGIRANGRDLRELPLMRLAYERWPSLHEAIDAPTGYERCGHLLLIERMEDRASAPVRAWMQEQQGIPTHQVEGAELREMEPWLGEEVQAALYCPKDGVADHTATTRGMAQAAARHGARIREQCAVTGLEVGGGRVRAVRTDADERIPVDGTLLLLANAAVHELLHSQLAITLPVWTFLPQVMLTAAVDPMPVQHLIGHAHRRLAMKPLARGATQHIMISGGWRGRWNAQRRRGDTQPDQIAGNLADARAVYPCLADVAVLEADAGRVETGTIDGVPIIDRVPGIHNAFFATGWTGHGWAIAPVVTRLLADWTFSGRQPALLRPFAYGRFGNAS